MARINIGTGASYINLERMVKALDGRAVTFMDDELKRPLSPGEASAIIATYVSEGRVRIPMREEKHLVTGMRNEHNSRKDRLEAELKEAEQAKMDYMRQHMTLRAPAKLEARIAALRDKIADCDRYAAHKLTDVIPAKRLKESGLSRRMVKLHLLCDVLADAAHEVRDTLKSLDIVDSDLYPLVSDILRPATAFANLVCHPEFAGLQDFITSDETLIRDINTLVQRYFDEYADIIDHDV